jgi:hypothetical protein
LSSAVEALTVPIGRKKAITIDRESAVSVALLLAALVVGLATAADYGVTIDEFNADDYGPKALAWYTSGFTDRSHFETVEFSLWYYGPWFQMLTAAVQSLGLADPLAIRHALTFAVGLAGIAALCPIGRLSFGRWMGPAAVAICLSTGYLYGNLFFAPIDGPFLAAMCGATLAIMVMARTVMPTWPATICAGIAMGLAIATRTGGIITHAYLIGAMVLCGVDAVLSTGSAARDALLRIVARTAAAIVVAWVVAIALWPWLQIGNPFTQFTTAYVHFATIATDFEFDHWGQRLMTNDLPWSYIPEQWLARLPIGFLALLATAVVLGIVAAIRWARPCMAQWRRDGMPGLRDAVLPVARSRNMLLVWVAAFAPVAFLMISHATLYDGIRHTLFVIPMLALLAGWAFVRLMRALGRARVVGAAAAIGYAGVLLANLATLHPLEYIATNAFAGGTAGSYERFELDYWSAAATEALRRLESRLDRADAFKDPMPSIVLCIPYREQMAGIMLDGKWRLETDLDKADFVIETQRYRCAADRPALLLIDEVSRYERAFAWTFVNQTSRYAGAVGP